MKKKIFIALLSTILMVTLMPLAVFADGTAGKIIGREGRSIRTVEDTQEEVAAGLAEAQAYSGELAKASVDVKALAEDLSDLSQDYISGQKSLEAYYEDATARTLELYRARLSAEDFAAARDMLEEDVIPVKAGETLFQLYNAGDSVYIYTVDNNASTQLTEADAAMIVTAIPIIFPPITYQTSFIISPEFTAEKTAIHHIATAKLANAYFLEGSLAKLSEADRAEVIELAAKKDVTVHLSDAEAQLVKDATNKTTAEIETVQDVTVIQATASSFGTGSIMLICACAGVFVLAGIIVVIVAKRREKSGQIEVEVKK